MKAESLGCSPGHGTSVEYIKCICGFENIFYIWSWAGHGALRCRKCGWWILYRTLECKVPGYRGLKTKIKEV